MQHIKLKLAAAITAALLSTTAMAETWEITQTTTPGAATIMMQNGATAAGSIQGMNVIKSSSATVKGGSSQTADVTAGALTLKQEGTTEASTQAANYMSLDTIGDTAAVTQTQTGDVAITLEQKAFTGNGGNTQAVNTAEAATEIVNLQQNSTTAATVKLDQTTTTGSNIQAVNNADAAKITTLDQNLSPDALDLDQTGGANTQAGNRAVAGTDGVATALTQDVTLGGNATLDQGTGTTAATAGSVQAGNLLTSSGAVASAIQKITADANDLTLIQNKSEDVKQAGNLIDVSATASELTSGEQEITTTGVLTLTQGTAAVTTSLQAGNAVLTGSDSDANVISQNVEAGELVMTQTAASGSIQAANFVGTDPTL